MSDKKKSLFSLSMKPKSGESGAPTGAATPPSKKDTNKRWIAVAAGGAVVLVMASAMFAEKSTPQRQTAAVDPNKAVVDVTPRGLEAKSLQKSLQVDLSELRARDAAREAELNELKKKYENMASSGSAKLPDGIVPPPRQDSKNLGALSGSDRANEPPPPPVPIDLIPGQKATPSNDLPPVPVGLPPLSAGGGQSSTPMVFKPEKKTPSTAAAQTPAAQNLAAATEGALSGNGLDTIRGKVEYKKNPYKGFMVAGAFAPVALLNGLDAGTSATTQSNPMPILMNIQDQANLPGAAKYKIRNCFVLGSAYGDLSAERVYARLSTLSCVDKNEKLVLSTPVQGYLVDSDGKIGMRGVVIDRQGAKLAKALLAGFAQGLSSALGSAQSTVSSSSLGTFSTVNGSNALQASGLQGGATAAQQLAQFYLKEASSIFPVISVDTGRTGTIVFTQGVSLNWGEADPAFIKEVKPE